MERLWKHMSPSYLSSQPEKYSSQDIRVTSKWNKARVDGVDIYQIEAKPINK
jgi:hypothetical protein